MLQMIWFGLSFPKMFYDHLHCILYDFITSYRSHIWQMEFNSLFIRINDCQYKIDFLLPPLDLVGTRYVDILENSLIGLTLVSDSVSLWCDFEISLRDFDLMHRLIFISISRLFLLRFDCSCELLANIVIDLLNVESSKWNKSWFVLINCRLIYRKCAIPHQCSMNSN